MNEPVVMCKMQVMYIPVFRLDGGDSFKPVKVCLPPNYDGPTMINDPKAYNLKRIVRMQ